MEKLKPSNRSTSEALTPESDQHQIPKGYVTISKAIQCETQEVNVIGVVKDFLLPGPTRGTDYQSTFTLTETPAKDYWNSSDLNVKFFKPPAKVNELPAIHGTGDVVVLRKVKIKTWRGMTVANSSWSTEWIHFPASSIPSSSSGSSKPQYLSSRGAKPPSAAEWLYVVRICNEQDRSTFSSPSKPVPVDVPILSSQVLNSTYRPPRQKFSFIKDLKPEVFADLCCEVVRMYDNAGRLELYATDYTSNPMLFNRERNIDETHEKSRDGDRDCYLPSHNDFSWPGPWERNSILITLWPPHSHFASENVKVGDYVLLRNVRTKISNGGYLEGNMDGMDTKYPDRINITIKALTDGTADDQLKTLLRARRGYWTKGNLERRALLDSTNDKKRRRASTASQESEKSFEGEKSKPSKKGRHKRKNINATAPSVNDQVSDIKLKHLEKIELNKNIKCSHMSKPPTLVSDILDSARYMVKTSSGIEYQLPFQNIKYRANVRVVDYFPKKLEDFSVPVLVSEYDVLSDSGNDDSEVDNVAKPWHETIQHGKVRWEWRFYLLVEDASKEIGAKADKRRLRLLVTEEEAVHLLRIDPCDLRRNDVTLSRLRETLFILWGDLEERTLAASRKTLAPVDRNNLNAKLGTESHESDVPAKTQPSARPFECCIQEYGVKSAASGTNGDGEERTTDEVSCTNWEKRFQIFGTTIR